MHLTNICSNGNASNSVYPFTNTDLCQIKIETSSRVDELFGSYSHHKQSVYLKISEKRVVHVLKFQNKTLLKTDDIQKESRGKSSAVLFFVHGVGASTYIWEKQFNYFLFHGYDIIAFDLLGHGKSSKPLNSKAFKFENLANDVLEVFDTYRKSTNNVVIGHSYGCAFCTLLSKERSSFIAKMVLISGGGPTILTPDKCSAFCLPFPFFYTIKPLVVRVFRRMAFHVNTPAVIRDKFMAFVISSYALKAVMQGQVWAYSDEHYHASLNIPVLLIHGKGDKFVSLSDELWMQETIYGSKLKVIEDAAHMAMIEAPTMVNEVIHDFLKQDASTNSTNTRFARGK